MSSIDSDLESLISNGNPRTKKVQRRNVREEIDLRNSKLQELNQRRDEIRNEMMEQCKVNECKFESLMDKKKRAKQVEMQILGMTQEFLLMQKQIDKKEKKANELHQQVEKVKLFNTVRSSRREVNNKFKVEKVNSNKEQVNKGIMLRDQSNRNKKILIESIQKSKHQMYLESKQKAKVEEERKKVDVGSTVNQKILQAKENKINEELGNLAKRNYTKSKINDLTSQISFRINNHNMSMKGLKSNVKDLMQSQLTLKKKLDKANKHFEQDYKEALKYNLVPENNKNRLQKLPTFNYNFSGFQEKVNKAQFLFFEENRKEQDYQEEVEKVKKHLELSLKLHETMPGLSGSKHQSLGKEISLKYF